MEKKLLVTVSEDKAAHFSIHFLGAFMENKQAIDITLFYTAPRAAGVGPATTLEEKLSMERMEEFYVNRGKKALAEAEKELLGYGFKKDQIKTKLVVRKFGKILDIIQEAEKGLYDAVLLGRRGLSLFEELFDQSVTKELLDHAITVPVWICRKPTNKNDIAVCFDGSEPSQRCLEHIAFMFKDEPKHRVVVITVTEDPKEIDELKSLIDKITKETGFDENRLNFNIIRGGRPVSMLLKAVKEDFGMVACGRSGKGTGLLGKIFMGSVSYELYSSLKDTTLCITR